MILKQSKEVKFANQIQLMRSRHLLFTFLTVPLLYCLAIYNAGCAQIGSPTGGPRDTIPPKLVSASPKINSTNVTGNKITLTFNEYIDLKDIQSNVLISPYPKKTPAIDFKLRTVTVKLKDSLLPNTTYSINFGNAIIDNNEGNPFKEFTYVFSTGKNLDTLILTGKVLIAETGKADSTLMAMLYRNADDSAVQKRKPDYITKLSGDGSFYFKNLPAGNFKVYALKDGDGGKTYNSKKELFAFNDAAITLSEKPETVLLYASAVEKESRPVTTTKPAGADKKLRLVLPIMPVQDLLSPFRLSFNKPLKKFDPLKIILTDTNYKAIPSTAWSIDSSRTKIMLTSKWQEDMQYRLILDSAAVSDSSDKSIARTDTLRLVTKKETDYGNVVLRFSNIDLTKHPVLQFIQGEELKESYPLTALEWRKKLMPPGEYEIRILYDDNNNGKWDTGDYSKKLQPEKAITLSQKLAVKANWDNERDIKL